MDKKQPRVVFCDRPFLVKLPTYKYVILTTLLGSFLGIHGILTDKERLIIAAMIMSPVGTIVLELSKYLHFYKLSFSKILSYLVIIFGITFSLGYLTSWAIIKYQTKANLFFTKNYSLPSKTMINDSKFIDIFPYTLTAILCGLVFPYAHFQQNFSIIVSLAISLSLTIPLLIMGLYMGLGDFNEKLIVPGLTFLINIVVIFLSVWFSLNIHCKNPVKMV